MLKAVAVKNWLDEVSCAVLANSLEPLQGGGLNERGNERVFDLHLAIDSIGDYHGSIIA